MGKVNMGGLTRVLLLTLLGAATALAHPQLDQARDAYRRGAFRDCLSRLRAAERSPDLTEPELVELYWYRGATEFALENRDGAAKAFEALLQVRPLHELDARDASPEIRAFFERQAAAYQAAQGVQMGQLRREGRLLTVPVDRTSPRVHQLLLYIRPRGAAPYRRVPLTLHDDGGPRTANAVVDDTAFWEAAAVGGGLEYVAEARTGSNVAISRVGDALQPLSLAFSEEDLANLDAPPPPALPAVPPPTPSPPPAVPPPPPPPPPAPDPAPQAAVPPPPSEPTAVPTLPPDEKPATSALPARAVLGGGITGLGAGGALVLVALVCAVLFVGLAAALYLSPSPPRQAPWFPAAQAAYVGLFWAGVAAVLTGGALAATALVATLAGVFLVMR